MTWRQFDLESRHVLKVLKEASGTCRFTLDNDIDVPQMLSYLDGIGISADSLPAKLKRASDEDVREYCWESDRLLITHDVGFLNKHLHPPEKNPGLIVIPGGSGDLHRHLKHVGNLLTFMKPYRHQWRGLYVHQRDTGMSCIDGITYHTGEPLEISRSFVTFDDRGAPYWWDSEPQSSA